MASAIPAAVVPKMEPPTEKHPDKDSWTSEMQYVSSLAKLQKIEAMIHQLRTLIPERLLEPVAPIVNPAVSGRPVPKSPGALYEQLSQAARGCIAEVGEFQALWRSPDMRAIWEHVEGRIKREGGWLPQPTGMWEREYDVLLGELERGERVAREQRRRVEEEHERVRIRSIEGGWRAIVAAFQRNVPGIRVLLSTDHAAMTVVLVKAGLVFHVQAINGEGQVCDWRVVDAGEPKTKLESAITACLNARPRQWDLAYLLDMISSYTDIKQTPCTKCHKLTNSAAQLPTIHQPKPGHPPLWESYHPACIAN